MEEQVTAGATEQSQVPPVVEKPKRQRRPRAQKPPRKPRIEAPFRLLKLEENGTFSDVGIDAGNTMDAALKQLRLCAPGQYWIVRGYSTKTVKVETVAKTTIE